MSRVLPLVEALDSREMLSAVLGQGFTNMYHDGDAMSSYYTWFGPAVGRLCQDDGTCMQDYSWMGEGFEPVTFKGAPAVNYVGRVPYVVDPVARKIWCVEDFLKEYPKAFDTFAKEIIPRM